MLRKALHTIVVLLLVVVTIGWTKPASAQSTRPTRCVIFLEPIQPGENSSKASKPLCSTGKIDSVNGYSLTSSFLLLRFYANYNYVTLIWEFYGAAACSPSISYGSNYSSTEPHSARSYSNCNKIHGYNYANYGGQHVICGSNCPYLDVPGGLSSWRLTYN